VTKGGRPSFSLISRYVFSWVFTKINKNKINLNILFKIGSSHLTLIICIVFRNVETLKKIISPEIFFQKENKESDGIFGNISKMCGNGASKLIN
jgi:hypothetical protein